MRRFAAMSMSLMGVVTALALALGDIAAMSFFSPAPWNGR